MPRPYFTDFMWSTMVFSGAAGCRSKVLWFCGLGHLEHVFLKDNSRGPLEHTSQTLNQLFMKEIPPYLYFGRGLSSAAGFPHDSPLKQGLLSCFGRGSGEGTTVTIRWEWVVFGWVHDPLMMAVPENQAGLHNPSETHLFSAIFIWVTLSHLWLVLGPTL